MKKVLVILIIGVAAYVLYSLMKPDAAAAAKDPAAQKPRPGADTQKTPDKPENPKDRGGAQLENEPKPGDTGAGWPYDPAEIPNTTIATWKR